MNSNYVTDFCDSKFFVLWNYSFTNNHSIDLKINFLSNSMIYMIYVFSFLAFCQQTMRKDRFFLVIKSIFRCRKSLRTLHLLAKLYFSRLASVVLFYLVIFTFIYPLHLLYQVTCFYIISNIWSLNIKISTLCLCVHMCKREKERVCSQL